MSQPHEFMDDHPPTTEEKELPSAVLSPQSQSSLQSWSPSPLSSQRQPPLIFPDWIKTDPESRHFYEPELEKEEYDCYYSDSIKRLKLTFSHTTPRRNVPRPRDGYLGSSYAFTNCELFPRQIGELQLLLPPPSALAVSVPITAEVLSTLPHPSQTVVVYSCLSAAVNSGRVVKEHGQASQVQDQPNPAAAPSQLEIDLAAALLDQNNLKEFSKMSLDEIAKQCDLNELLASLSAYLDPEQLKSLYSSTYSEGLKK